MTHTNHPFIDGIALLIVNAFIFMISFQLVPTLQAILLIISISYTLYKFITEVIDRRKSKKKK